MKYPFTLIGKIVKGYIPYQWLLPPGKITKKVKEAMTEQIPTLGNLITAIDATLKDVPKSCYPIYAKSFEDTIIEAVIFTGSRFGEAASEYCRETGWREPS